MFVMQQSPTKLQEALKVQGFYDEIPGLYKRIPGGRYSDDPRKVYNDFLDQKGDYYLGGVSLNNVLDLGPVTFKSLTAYRSSIKTYTSDVDATDLPNIHYLGNRDESKAFSQEFQLLSNATGPFEWIIGGFYLHDKAAGRDPFDIRSNFNTVAVPVVVPFHLDIGNQQTTNAFAAFGQASYEIVEHLKATVGLRYSYERKSAHLTQQIPEFGVDAAIDIKGSWKALTPKFGLEYNDGKTLV